MTGSVDIGYPLAMTKQFMTTQWTPRLNRDGKVIVASSRGYIVKPGARVEMSDRTYSVLEDGSIRRTDAAHTKLSKKARTRKRRGGSSQRLSKRERAAIQSAQEIARRSDLVSAPVQEVDRG